LEDFLTLNNQLCFAVYGTASEFNKLYTTALQPFELTYPQYLVLLALWERDELSVKELGLKLNLGTGTLTPMLSRMEANGWVKKARSKTDERRVFIYLQEKARSQKPEITKKIAKTIQSCQIEYEDYLILMEQLKNLQIKLRNQPLEEECK
jgi:MarR family transcriptional regulator, organic hydroperoxide resistance regulator